MAWAASSTAVTVCWYRAAAPGQAYIAPVLGMSSKAVTPPDNTAHILQMIRGETRAGHIKSNY